MRSRLSYWSKYRIGALTLLGYFITASACYLSAKLPGMFEPDRLFHLAFFNEMERQGTFILRTWAQLPFIGWDRYVSDKEFLYHLISYVPFRIAREEGFLAACGLYAAAIVWLPFALRVPARKQVLLAGIFLLFTNAFFLYRLSLSRPHVLAVALFAGMVISIVTHKRTAAAGFGLTFSLAYHAFYIPLSFALLTLAIEAMYLKRKVHQASLLAIGGLLAGLVINPYFPSNLIRSLQTLVLGINPGGLPNFVRERIGRELLPMNSATFLPLFAPSILAFLYAAILLRKKREMHPAIGLGSILWAASVFSPRTLEFVFPLTALVWGLAWREADRWKGLALSILFVTNISSAFHFRQYLFKTHEGIVPLARFAALLERVIPRTSGSTVVFHDRWDLAAYTLYLRPDVVVPEVLDPTYLWMHDQARSELTSQLYKGNVARSADAIREVFGAQYAVADGGLTKRLSKDPEAEELGYLKDLPFTVYRIKP